jgi:hypothetical protein
MKELPTTYNIFWRELRPALQAAEARTAANKYVEAIRRLKEGLEGESQGPGHGQTGYLDSKDADNPINPYQAIKDYIAHMYDGKPAPEWLRLAERG